MKKLILFIIVLVLMGCCDGPVTSKKTGEKYYPVKICSIGDNTGESCVEYAVKKYCMCNSNMFEMTTIDGHTYEFNYSGWSIVVTKK